MTVSWCTPSPSWAGTAHRLCEYDVAPGCMSETRATAWLASSAPVSSRSSAAATPAPASVADTVTHTGCVSLCQPPSASGPETDAAGAVSSSQRGRERIDRDVVLPLVRVGVRPGRLQHHRHLLVAGRDRPRRVGGEGAGDHVQLRRGLQRLAAQVRLHVHGRVGRGDLVGHGQRAGADAGGGRRRPHPVAVVAAARRPVGQDLKRAGALDVGVAAHARVAGARAAEEGVRVFEVPAGDVGLGVGGHGVRAGQCGGCVDRGGEHARRGSRWEREQAELQGSSFQGSKRPGVGRHPSCPRPW